MVTGIKRWWGSQGEFGISEMWTIKYHRLVASNSLFPNSILGWFHSHLRNLHILGWIRWTQQVPSIATGMIPELWTSSHIPCFDPCDVRSTSPVPACPWLQGSSARFVIGWMLGPMLTLEMRWTWCWTRIYPLVIHHGHGEWMTFSQWNLPVCTRDFPARHV